MTVSLYDLSYEDLQSALKELGEKPFHAKQIFKWLYEKRVSSIDEMSDLSLALRETLKEKYPLKMPAVKTKQESSDGTIKYLFELEDGSLIESVLMVFDYGYSACLTTQVGCNMGCAFCASGLLKKQRDLTPGEIITQALFIQKQLDENEERLSNLVIMGTGEPFDNYENVMKALSVLNHPFGLAIGARHISVSTSGLVPKILRFAKEGVQYNLAISLHASNDELRSKLMPVNRAYPLEQLMQALDVYAETNNRRLTFEYLLLSGINDNEKNADELKELLRGRNAYINLIPYNEVKEMDFRSSSPERTLRFYDMLKKRGIAVTLRQKKGDDIDAACGQLRAKNVQ
ncbi:MAG: 23S rRNA (adenine(2503)-C(2))-methyltransferase RlmN [Erysipelotrichaceae bacterium]|jgi:23S rRNA (adenine2503-C2)-methyltransferase|nr:23S rRNA (adenine(2503)-C(2))-methyltransferase RlmN [Erysipelotrichaceae bacterium]MCR5299445.1 23S rRNA (adenine(2503)-C(2))-methyltransferase RlmN [Erysipelotrichaceae bacterium]